MDAGNKKNEPSHEIMVLFVLQKRILQTHKTTHPMGLDVWFFVYFHTSCVRTANTLARLRGNAGSPVHSLVAYVWKAETVKSYILK